MFIFGQALLQPVIGDECEYVSFTLAWMSHDKTSQLHNMHNWKVFWLSFNVAVSTDVLHLTNVEKCSWCVVKFVMP